VKWILTFALTLMLASTATAVQESRQVGPYTVSFNMNTPQAYTVEPAQTQSTPSGTADLLTIVTNNETGATIGITQYNNLTDSTVVVGKTIRSMNMILSGLNVSSSPVDMVIDDKPGFVITGVATVPAGAPDAGTQVALYEASYWLDSVNCQCGPVSVGKTNIVIRSTYSQEITQGLLSSLHVTGGATAGTADMGTPTAAGQQAQLPPTTVGQVVAPPVKFS
jgi:hypothetical protein